MRHIIFPVIALMPTLAWAQQTPVQQSSPPTLQQVLDQKSALVYDAIAVFRGQIVQDNATITTLSQQNSDLTAKSEALQKQVDNLQAQLKAATEPTKTSK